MKTLFAILSLSFILIPVSLHSQKTGVIDSFNGYGEYNFGDSFEDCNCAKPTEKDYRYECVKFPSNSYVSGYKIYKIALGFYKYSTSLNIIGLYLPMDVSTKEVLSKLKSKYGEPKIQYEYDYQLKRDSQVIDSYEWEGVKVTIAFDLVEVGNDYIWYVYHGDKVEQGF